MCTVRRRMKASDVFRENPPWLGRPTSFSNAFPTVADVRVDVAEENCGQVVREMVFTGATGGEYVDCSNPLCYNGGFRLGQTLRFMVERKATDDEFSVSCRGYEGSPKGRIKYDKCMRRFRVKVHITLKVE